ncbi:Opi1-domain-containing protein [Ascodesmis nigricans]|uniref:Opi1-domain-containing protein n=1 Tax=Ascodesmis nigricans TaxID=341454 RepID=A0A4S2MK33_9PEZI|nr:Opi1-domain-containing protein [Ascodesmis nigricans]
MATKTRYRSSPSPSPAPISRTSIVLEPVPSPALTNILSKETFPAPLPLRPHQSEHLEVLDYHNARPEGQSKIILPPATSPPPPPSSSGSVNETHTHVRRGGEHVLHERPANPYGHHHHQNHHLHNQTHTQNHHQHHQHTSWSMPEMRNMPYQHHTHRRTLDVPFNLSTSPPSYSASMLHHHPPSYTQKRKSENDRTRDLSIQNLISSPPPPPQPVEMGEGFMFDRGMKRKGSDEDIMSLSRSSRGTSVVSSTGLSMEDPDVRDAVEALGGLKADLTHTSAPQSPQPPTPTPHEPLLNLLQNSPSVHPLLSTALSISSTTYTTSKHYIPPFRYVAERTETLATTIGRRTGIETYLRRGLTRQHSTSSSDSAAKRLRRADGSAKPTSTTAAAGDEKALLPAAAVSSGTPSWQRRLYYTSTGLATALSDDSRRSLKYCLRILALASTNLLKVIETLTNVVDELDQYLAQTSSSDAITSGEGENGRVRGYLPESYDQRRQRIAETVDRLKDEALKTLKQVVDTISRYAGGALPEQARELVKRQLLTFPQRWRQAAAPETESPADSAVVRSENGVVGEAIEVGGQKGKAVRVLVMAREGLVMMRSVAEVVEGTLVSAEEWCGKLGRKVEGEGEGEGEEGGEKVGEKEMGGEGGKRREKEMVVGEGKRR